MRGEAPAVLRNRETIAAVLREELPASGLVLEVASGTGEHAVYFAQAFPKLDWQPSDFNPEALVSIAGWREHACLPNVCEPLRLDATEKTWPIAKADAIVCINMMHISPIEASTGLVAGARRILDQGAPLIVYGPYMEEHAPTAGSNIALNYSLKKRDPQWGLRDVSWLDGLCTNAGLARTRRVAMAANNIMLIYRMTS